MIRSLVLIISLSTLCACAGESSPFGLDSSVEPIDDISPTDGSNRDNPSVQPLFVCPEGFAIAGVDKEGQPQCAFIGAEGFLPKLQSEDSELTCPEGYHLTEHDNQTTSTTLAACSRNLNNVPVSVAFGQPAFADFACPYGSALRGFDDLGVPLCQSNGFTPSGLARAPHPQLDVCPLGHKRQWIEQECDGSSMCRGERFHVTVCAAHEETYLPHRVGVSVVALEDSQLGFVCPQGEWVVGYDERRRPICATIQQSIDDDYGHLPANEGGNKVFCPPGLRLRQAQFAKRIARKKAKGLIGCYREVSRD